MPRIPSTLLFLLSLVPLTGAGAESALRDAGPADNLRLAGTETPGAQQVYIVQLRAPSAAEFHAARTAALGKTAGVAAPRLDKNDPGIRDHAAKLLAEQDRVLALAGPGTGKIYNYVYGLNGFAARMSPAAAHKLEAVDEVARVWADEIRPLATNYSPEFLDLYEGENSLRGGLGLDGEDVIIGFIDSGVYPEHPALADTVEADRPRACRSSWGENSLLGRWLCRKYRRLEDRVVYEPPAEWNGECETGDSFEATACNNKLIGARWFAEGAQAGSPIDDAEIFSPRDVDGHGTHTATTAAGNRVTASIRGSEIGRVEGMAPRARVAVYKACWLRAGDTRATCNASDLARAVDAAVADGVDIINYSVGSSLLKIAAPDDIALFGAAKAGILAVVAAGNDGPNLGTIGSPAGGPWVLTTAASTREGETSLEAMEIDAPSGLAGRYAVREAEFTPRLADEGPVEGLLVLADDGEDVLANGGPGTTSDACEALVNDDEVDGNIALVARGGCDFDVKVGNAADAGAAGVVVYNDAGTPFVMRRESTSVLDFVPAVMVGQADGNLFVSELDTGSDIEAVLDDGLVLTEPEAGNLMPNFSSRGPGPVPDILKPDVTAPGVNILAGISPDSVSAVGEERYGYLTGTSMATPHVSGVAALLREKYPDWSPAALKSALMTTARQDVTQPDAETPAHLFDFGAGHIVPNAAGNPGLVFDLADDDYDAAACGFAYEAVTAERCAELEAAGRSFRVRDMNLPSISVGRLTGATTVTRRVTNVAESAQTFAASVEAPPGMQLTVNPPSLSLAPGATAEFDVTVGYGSGDMNTWRFGSLTWTSADHVVRSPVAVRPVAVSAPAEVTGEGTDGSLEFGVEFGYTGVYDARGHGLRLPAVFNAFVDNDPTRTFTFRTGNGVTAHLVDVPANQLYLRFALFDALTDGDDDLDMYVYYCTNDTCSKIGESGEPTSQERFDYYRPPAGRYAVLVHGFATDEVAGGPGANYTLLGWSVGEDDDRGNLAVTAPSFINAGTTEAVGAQWFGLQTGTIYLGAVSHNTQDGLAGLTLITILVP